MLSHTSLGKTWQVADSVLYIRDRSKENAPEPGDLIEADAITGERITKVQSGCTNKSAKHLVPFKQAKWN